MIIKDIMTSNIVSVELDDTLAVVKEIFDHVKFHHLLVIEHNKLFGVISDRDLFKALSPNIGTLAETNRDLATLNKKVHQIVTRKPVSINPDANIHDAIEIFMNNQISCIPVTDETGHPVGIISWRDIFSFVINNSK